MASLHDGQALTLMRYLLFSRLGAFLTSQPGRSPQPPAWPGRKVLRQAPRGRECHLQSRTGLMTDFEHFIDLYFFLDHSARPITADFSNVHA